jgi:Winged helix DNA-binding domain
VASVDLIEHRLRSHLLAAPEGGVVAAARHMVATQAQEWWAGRWGLALRTSGTPGAAAVDSAFDDGLLVRSWTQRGTLHIVAAGDLRSFLALTADRQHAQAASVHRSRGIDAAVIARVERSVHRALADAGRLSRAELFDVMRADGLDTGDMRGSLLLQALSLRGLICQGPTRPEPDGLSREQWFVLVDDVVPEGKAADLATLFTRFVHGHGPASSRDFAWWMGLTRTAARAAALAATDVGRLDDDLWAPLLTPRDPAAPDLVALPAFDEYVLSYVDRSAVCAPEDLSAVGPTANGVLSPVLLHRGRVVGTWTHSRARGRLAERPVATLFATAADQVAPGEIEAALSRYTGFLRG